MKPEQLNSWKPGYEILERNFRGARGEIDLIARQENCLVFIV